MPAREDPFVAVFFNVEFGTNLKGSFMEAKGFGSSSEVQELKQNLQSGKLVIIKTPGLLKWTDITLKKGLTDSLELWAWFKKVQQGKMQEARVNGTITLHNEQGAAVAKFEFTNAWPTAIVGPSLTSDGNEIGVEEITITHEGYKRVKV